ncbi:MAG: VWA domain-containing protein [Nannocystaceae bacterium]|nr:VWA domain-containing protein [Nannocystaceae bacterium]
MVDLDRARWCPLALLGLAWHASPAAAADLVDGTRGAVAEREHTITLALDRGHARLEVERTLFNPDHEFDEGVITFELPPGAAAVGLRTLATTGGRERWYEAELLDADTAATRYEALVGVGVREPKDPALLHWLTPETMRLRVFPIAPLERKTVAYDLVVPTDYVDGEHVLALPRLGSEAIVPQLVVVAAHAGDALAIDGEPARSGVTVALDQPHRLSLRPDDAPMLTTRLGRVSLARHDVIGLELEAASTISTVPDDAHVVVLIDVSRSHATAIAPAQAAARATLARFAGHGAPAFAVMSFARTVHEHTRGWADLEAADAALATELPSSNGSRIDDALRAAAARLREAPAGAPRRILLFTDALARAALRPASLRATLADAGALVHVIEVDSGEPELARVDGDAWSQLAASTGGVRWRAQALLEGSDRGVFESLVRPTQLDHVHVLQRGGVPLLEDETLREGAGVRLLDVHDAGRGAITLTAQLWSTPIRRALRADASHSRLIAALAVPRAQDLPARELEVLARRGRAVSPVTSYLAVEPGVRPMRIGLREGEGVAMVRSAQADVRGHHLGPVEIELDRVAFLEVALRDAASRCEGPRSGITAVLELTRAEIVDVTRLALQPDALDPDDDPEALLQCLTEAVWAIEVAPAFTDERASWTVEI